MTKLNINNLKIAACEQTELNDFGEGIFPENTGPRPQPSN